MSTNSSSETAGMAMAEEKKGNKRGVNENAAEGNNGESSKKKQKISTTTAQPLPSVPLKLVKLCKSHVKLSLEMIKQQALEFNMKKIKQEPKEPSGNGEGVPTSGNTPGTSTSSRKSTSPVLATTVNSAVSAGPSEISGAASLNQPLLKVRTDIFESGSGTPTPPSTLPPQAPTTTAPIQQSERVIRLQSEAVNFVNGRIAKLTSLKEEMQKPENDEQTAMNKLIRNLFQSKSLSLLEELSQLERDCKTKPHQHIPEPKLTYIESWDFFYVLMRVHEKLLKRIKLKLTENQIFSVRILEHRLIRLIHIVAPDSKKLNNLIANFSRDAGTLKLPRKIYLLASDALKTFKKKDANVEAALWDLINVKSNTFNMELNAILGLPLVTERSDAGQDQNPTTNNTQPATATTAAGQSSST